MCYNIINHKKRHNKDNKNNEISSREPKVAVNLASKNYFLSPYVSKPKAKNRSPKQKLKAKKANKFRRKSALKRIERAIKNNMNINYRNENC